MPLVSSGQPAAVCPVWSVFISKRADQVLQRFSEAALPELQVLPQVAVKAELRHFELPLHSDHVSKGSRCAAYNAFGSSLFHFNLKQNAVLSTSSSGSSMLYIPLSSSAWVYLNVCCRP